MNGVFDLKKAKDLFQKLEREYKRLLENENDSDTAFNFFVTAWHLLEWQFPGNENDAKRKEIRDDHLILQICEHLAVGAKHFRPNRDKHQSVASSDKGGVWASGAWGPNTWGPNTWKTWLEVELTSEAEVKFGKKVDKASDFAKLAMDYWRSEFPENSAGA